MINRDIHKLFDMFFYGSDNLDKVRARCAEFIENVKEIFDRRCENLEGKMSWQELCNELKPLGFYHDMYWQRLRKEKTGVSWDVTMTPNGRFTLRVWARPNESSPSRYYCANYARYESLKNAINVVPIKLLNQ